MAHTILVLLVPTRMRDGRSVSSVPLVLFPISTCLRCASAASIPKLPLGQRSARYSFHFDCIRCWPVSRFIIIIFPPFQPNTTVPALPFQSGIVTNFIKNRDFESDALLSGQCVTACPYGWKCSGPVQVTGNLGCYGNMGAPNGVDYVGLGAGSSLNQAAFVRVSGYTYLMSFIACK